MTDNLWKNTEDVDKNFKKDFKAGPIAWLVKQAKPDMDILLAHADDGIIWGKVRDNTLVLAGSEFPKIDVKLREQTLQQARLFGPAGELLVWRVNDNFEARLIEDGSNVSDEQTTTEEQWLWGAKDTRKKGKIFTLLREGKQGLLHAPPVELKNNEGVALKVRHYIENDDKGQAYIALSRLTGLSIVKERDNGA